MVHFPPVLSTHAASHDDGPHNYCFPVAQVATATTKSNGYLQAETALNSSKDKVTFCLSGVPYRLWHLLSLFSLVTDVQLFVRI
jgi:hypothetical protein